METAVWTSPTCHVPFECCIAFFAPLPVPRSNFISYEYTETAFKDKMGAFLGSTYQELSGWTPFARYGKLLAASGGSTLPLPANGSRPGAATASVGPTSSAYAPLAVFVSSMSLRFSTSSLFPPIGCT